MSFPQIYHRPFSVFCLSVCKRDDLLCLHLRPQPALGWNSGCLSGPQLESLQGGEKEARDAGGKCECGGMESGLKNISRLGKLSDERMKQVVFCFLFFLRQDKNKKKIHSN